MRRGGVMSRKINTDRNAIVDAVIGIIEESGFEAVSARTIAARLNVSTQPIYREFSDMGAVRAAAIDRGFEIFDEYVSGEALDRTARYVMFAVEHGNLFDFLFRSAHYEYDGLDDLAHKLYSKDIIDRLMEITGLPRDKTYRLHLYVWMALHGLASMAADNSIKLSEADIKDFARDITGALTAFYKES